MTKSAEPWYLWNAFANVARRDPKVDMAEQLTVDLAIGFFALVLGVVGLLMPPNGHASSLPLLVIGVLLMLGPLLVWRRPHTVDVVVFTHGVLLLVMTVYLFVAAFDSVGSGRSFRYLPLATTWLGCHATLHWAHLSRGRAVLRWLPRVVLVGGLAAELMLCLSLLQHCSSYSP